MIHGIPEKYKCPIAKKLMKCPYVTDDDGKTYDEATLIEWEKYSIQKKPKILGLNRVLLQEIKEFIKENNLADVDVFFKAAIDGEKRDLEDQLFLGVDINCRDEHGNTGIHLVCMKGHVHLIDWFVSKKANINCENRNNQLPIEVAIMNGIPCDHPNLQQLWNQSDLDDKPILKAFRELVKRHLLLKWKA